MCLEAPGHLFFPLHLLALLKGSRYKRKEFPAAPVPVLSLKVPGHVTEQTKCWGMVAVGGWGGDIQGKKILQHWGYSTADIHARPYRTEPSFHLKTGFIYPHSHICMQKQ